MTEQQPVVKPQVAPRQAGVQLSPEETLLAMQNEIQQLRNELQTKDETIAKSNMERQVLEANKVLFEEKSATLEKENIRMNNVIKQSVEAMKKLQDENGQLQQQAVDEENKRRTERTANIENMENMLARPTKKMRLDSALTPAAPPSNVTAEASPVEHLLLPLLPEPRQDTLRELYLDTLQQLHLATEHCRPTCREPRPV